MTTQIVTPERQAIEQSIESKRQDHHDKEFFPKELYADLWDKATKVFYTAGDYAHSNKEIFYDRWAMNQLFQRYRVPILFYDRCSAGLKASIFTEHISDKTRAKNKLILRFSGPQTVRAVVTTKYGILDDHELFPRVLDILEEQGAEIHGFHYDDHITQLFATWPDCESEYQGFLHHAGVMITNSETSRSSIWVEPSVIAPHTYFVNRRTLKKQGKELRLIHRGNMDVERVVPMVIDAKRVAQIGIVQLAEAWENRVSGTQALELVHEMETLPGRIQDILDEEWQNEEIMNRVVIATRIMELARTLPLFQRISVEQEASAITGVFDNYEQRFQSIMEDA